jgi:hypothetical protein
MTYIFKHIWYGNIYLIHADSPEDANEEMKKFHSCNDKVLKRDFKYIGYFPENKKIKVIKDK